MTAPKITRPKFPPGYADKPASYPDVGLGRRAVDRIQALLAVFRPSPFV